MRQETERSARRAVGEGANCVVIVPASGVPAARHLLSIASAACAPGVSAWRSGAKVAMDGHDEGRR